MERLTLILKSQYDIESAIHPSKDLLYGTSDYIDISIQSPIYPCNSSDFKWRMVIVPAASSFTYTATKNIIKDFNTIDDVIDFLMNHELEIYQRLFWGLSDDYDRMWRN